MKKKTVHINFWLLPFSWLYGFIVYIRSLLFKCNILKQKKYDIPVICVGNITVGGTGKTPHTEYLVNILKKDFRVAVLSRGYKRKTRGFVLATSTSTSKEIGDEPLQIKRKFPDIIVAVDAKRQRGIENLLSLDEEERPQVILLDDAYQHRYVKPSYSILLSNYNRPIYCDKLLPAGRLREPVHNAEQANIIIVSKCPKDIKPIDFRILTHNVNPYPYQSLFFTTLKYGELTPVAEKTNEKRSLESLKNKQVLIIAGIANPRNFIKKVKKFCKNADSMIYPDHYSFKSKDIKEIESRYKAHENTIIVTTEKDAMRLENADFSEDLKKSLYYLPIEIAFIGDNTQQDFNKKIIRHVRKNSRNSELHKK